MTARYEIYLCDDSGRRLKLLENVAFFSYARTVSGFSNCTVALPFDAWEKEMPSIFSLDWRIDIWRSPIEGVPARREKSFFLRKYVVYQRQDGMRIIELFGRDAKDMLRRQYIDTWTVAGNTNYIDDLMKYIVTNYLVGTTTVPTGELVIDGNASEGPSITTPNFLNRNMLDALDEMNDASESLNLTVSTNKVIYFDMIEDDSLITNGFGYNFRTYAELRGADRTSDLLFSVENGNINEPNYFEDFLDAHTVFDVYNEDEPTADASASNNDQYLSR